MSNLHRRRNRLVCVMVSFLAPELCGHFVARDLIADLIFVVFESIVVAAAAEAVAFVDDAVVADSGDYIMVKYKILLIIVVN